MAIKLCNDRATDWKRDESRLIYEDAAWLNDDEWERLPLFPHLPPCPSVLMNADEDLFADPFLTELLLSKPLQRLKDIGFLGALDYIKVSNGSDAHRRRHNRFDHSLGVAELALLYSDIRGLPRKETRVLAAAGLLHDIGHGPLSHTLEPIFKASFGANHHEQVHVNSRDLVKIEKILSLYAKKLSCHEL